MGRWRPVDESAGIDEVVPLILESLGEQGIGAMIRVDAERLAEGRPHWTFAAGGGPLESGMRADGPTAAACMSLAMARLRELGVDIPF